MDQTWLTQEKPTCSLWSLTKAKRKHWGILSHLHNSMQESKTMCSGFSIERSLSADNYKEEKFGSFSAILSMQQHTDKACHMEMWIFTMIIWVLLFMEMIHIQFSWKKIHMNLLLLEKQCIKELVLKVNCFLHGINSMMQHKKMKTLTKRIKRHWWK